eukprot:2469778-Amphidinium_carterae.1
MTRLTKKPCGTRCKGCSLAAHAYPGVSSWEEMVTKASANPGFKKEFMTTRAVALGEKPKAFTSESVAHEIVTGFSVERSFLLLTPDEFRRKFDIPPTDVPGVHVEQFYAENGEVQEFVVVDDGAARRLKLRSTVEIGVEESLLQPQGQFRSKQGVELKDRWLQDWRATQFGTAPRAMGAPALSLASLMEKVEQTKRQREAEEAARQLVQPPAPVVPAAAEPARAEDAQSDMIDDDDMEEDL